jgi:hypothetical protein
LIDFLLRSMGSYEGADIGVTWGNMSEIYNNFAFQTSLSLLILDTFLYSFLGWYFGKIVPREWGVVSKIPRNLFYFRNLDGGLCGSFRKLK